MTQDPAKRKIGAFGYAIEVRRVSWRDLAVALWPIVLVSAIAIWIAFRFVRPAPPDTITLREAVAQGDRNRVLKLLQEVLGSVLSAPVLGELVSQALKGTEG